MSDVPLPKTDIEIKELSEKLANQICEFLVGFMIITSKKQEIDKIINKGSDSP
jgi:hypothetical protein